MTGHGEGARPGYEERLQAFTGRELRAAAPAQDPVNQPMIRHWAEAMGDTNPVYTDAEAARATGREGVVAPASMVQAWTMRGYAATVAPQASGPSGFDELAALLDEGGYTSVVATDSEFTFLRELSPGDHVAVGETVESVSAEKRTGLGTGRFVTTLKTYTDQHGETVATQRWRTLRFRPAPGPAAAGTAQESAAPGMDPAAGPGPAVPGVVQDPATGPGPAAAGVVQDPATGPGPAAPGMVQEPAAPGAPKDPATGPGPAAPGTAQDPAAGPGPASGASQGPETGTAPAVGPARLAPAAAEPAAPRPRPAINRDNAFFFEGARQHQLLVQRCVACSALRHPPGPCCPECTSLEWDTVEAAGHGHVYSFVVSHHPRHPAFDAPYLVAVVELAEGTRIVTNLTGVAPDEVTIGLPVVLDWLDTDPDLTLPVFRPAPTEAP